MLDRQKVEAILTRRFPEASAAQIAAAANAIMGLKEEWEEVGEVDFRSGVGPWTHRGDTEVRVFRRRDL